MKLTKKIQKVRLKARDQHIINDYKQGLLQEKLDIQKSQNIIEDWKNSNSKLSKTIDHFLNRENAKIECINCKQKRWMFCTKCNSLLHPLENIVSYKFPIELIIYRHVKEIKSKSSVFSLQLFTENSQSFQYPENEKQIQKLIQDDQTWILYPHKDSVNQKEKCL